MPIISKIRLKLNTANSGLWGTSQWIKSGTRNGLTIPDTINPGVSDITINLPYLNKPTGNEYYYVADNGALDIGANDITLAGWVYTADKAAEYNLIGKLVIGSANGRYGIAQAITTGMLYGMIQSSGGTYYCGGTIDGSTGWHFVFLEVDQTVKVIRLYVDNVQSGDDVPFTGTFNALATAFEFHIGTANNSTGTTKSGTAKSSHSDTYLYTSLLTSTQKTTLFQRGNVSGAKAHWTMMNTEGYREYDVSGNGYHLTGVNITSSKYLFGDYGSRHGLDVGFTHYQNGFGNIYVGLKADGTAITPAGIDPGYKITAEGIHLGDTLNYNLANAMLVIPGWDRSNSTIFNEAARRTYTYYNASAPTQWHPTELNNLLIQSWKNTGYKGTNFVKVLDYSYKSRKKLTELFSFSTDKTGTEYSILVDNYCGDYVFVDTYENDYIQWKPENNVNSSIITVEGVKVLKWENAATDKFWLSTDNGETYSISINSPKNGKVPTFAYIFQNGNILIGFEQNIYLSTDNLTSLSEITVKDIAGNDFVATNNSYYFFVYRPNIIVDGVEMFIFGTYDSAIADVTEHLNINIFYTVDGGATIKSCYKAGVTDPPLLGARHIHSVNYRAADGSFWVCTGDNETTYTGESNILKGVYDWDLDTWTWEKLYGSLDADCTYKLISIEFPDATNVLCGDDNTTSTIRNGLWTCPIADLGSSANFTAVFKTILGGGMVTYLDGDEFLAGHANLLNTNVLVTSKTGVSGLVGLKIYGLPAGITGFFPMKKLNNGWRLVFCGLDGVALGDGLSSPNILWVKIK